MRIVNPDEADRNRNGKQYPCQVAIKDFMRISASSFPLIRSALTFTTITIPPTAPCSTWSPSNPKTFLGNVFKFRI